MPFTSIISTRQVPDGTGLAISELGPRSDDERARDAEKYLSTLAEIRLPWESQIDNIIRFVNHSRRRVMDKDLSSGQKTGEEVFDGTALLAKNLLVDGMVGYLCSRNLKWFAYTLPGKMNFPRTSTMRSWNGMKLDQYPVVARWLQDCEDVAYARLQESNFYDVVTEFVSDGASVATATMLIEEDSDTGRLVFQVPHFRENFISTNQWGMVDTLYRVYKMTLRQLARKFGMATMQAVDANFESAYKSNMHAECEILHAVYPREDFDPWRIDSKNMKWESLWVYRKGTKRINSAEVTKDSILINENGYDSMPFVVWRWRTNSDEWYGRGPSHDAYVDIVLSQHEGRTNLEAAQKLAEPPLIAYADLRNQIQRGPNGITFIESNRGDIRMRAPMPLHTGLQQGLPYSLEYQEKTRAIIKEHFHVDFFLMLYQLGMAKVEVTATQVIEMMGEKAAILGTRIGRLQSEAFSPIHSRVFELNARSGMLPYPPQILWDQQVDKPTISYIGPLAEAQLRLSKVRSITSGLQLATQISQLNPIAMDVVDLDKSMNEALMASGFPMSCFRDPKDVEKIREIRNQQMEQQRQVDAIPKLAKAAAAAGRTTEEGSPLGAMLGKDENK